MAEKLHNIFSKDNLPDMSDSKKYRKVSLTRAKRMPYPFIVKTSEGLLTCDDGYLCIDARGYPYPVAKDEFDKIYVETPDGQ